MTVEEELSLLEDNLRKLKIEYEVYFSGGSKKPPEDLEWRVRNVVKKFRDGRTLTFRQQFRYNALAQKYAVFSDLWRRKVKVKEEGYRRPQDALLAIQGLRPEEEHEAALALGLDKGGTRHAPPQFEFTDARAELDKAQALYRTLVDARNRAGVPPGPGFDSFLEFLSKKTEEIRSQYDCASVAYSIELEKGQVRLRARGKS